MGAVRWNGFHERVYMVWHDLHLHNLHFDLSGFLVQQLF
ncbi:protein of unknown function [Candidatus Methylacidiphilum fumarolicum]|uniref:Uncharacterized protein n=1 Tax=Candidatus Methylacidiphilum fumarolicum TaxID=591154 RepID=A0ABM9IC58_9BACT|nr:protein of unknown function [Candidatus Methylacidiphilum fumarolicum]